MSVFTEKNAARREGRDRVGPYRYREARALRRRYTAGGAFGQHPFVKLWDDLAVGTRGEGDKPSRPEPKL